MLRKINLYRMVFLLFFTAQNTQAISLDKAVEGALTNSYKVKIKNEAIQETEYDLKRARSGYYPQVNIVAEGGEEFNNPFSSNDLTASTKGDFNHSYNAALLVSQPLYDGSRTDSSVEKRKSMIFSSKINKVEETEKVVFETIESYLQVYRNKILDGFSKDHYQEMARINNLVTTLIKSGAENKLTESYVNSKFLSAKNDLARIKNEFANSKLTFTTLTGLDIEENKLAIPKHANKLIKAELQELYQISLKHNTKIALEHSELNTVKLEQSEVKADYRPNINLELKAQQSENVGGDVGEDQNVAALLRLNYNLFDGFETENRENKVKSKIRQKKYKIKEIARNIKNQITSLHSSVNLLDNKIDLLLEEISSLKDYSKLSLLKYEKGRGNINDLIDANLDLYSKRKEFANSYFELVNKLFELQKVTGIIPKP